MENSLKLFLLVASCLAVISHIDANPQPGKVLKAVTIRITPFVYEKDGQFQGFIVDLMDAIAEKTDIKYELYLSPDGRYGNKGLDGNVNGMIGEVYNEKADLAAADLTVTEAREQLIDFTEPFMVNHLGAIVRKEDADGMHTLEDLFQDDKQFTVGSLRSGSTNHLLSKSEDPLAKKLYEAFQKSDGNSMVSSMKEGVDRVMNSTNYALIVESSFGENEVAHNCDLKMLKDEKSLYPRKYAMALPNGSPLLEKFNDAIKELKQNGEIDKLKAKYWKNDCENMEQPMNMDITTMMTPAEA